MAETDPSVEDNHEDFQALSEEDLRTHIRNEQSARSFFALLSFLVALVLLAVFLNNSFDEISRLLVLAAMIAFGMIGMLLLDKKRILDHNHIPAHTIETSEETLDRDGQDEEEAGEISTQNESDGEEIPALSPFEQLVREALDSIPKEFQQQMANLVVIVEDEPDTEVLTRSHVEENSLLLGLYSGVPLTALGSNHQMLPERITIYQHNIEMICHNNPDLIREKVRETVLHEVAHHFGMGHEEMPIWLK
jgi:predicted Zn-dependent protease with MMP-like domain